jgi:hypothetical protein
MQPNDTKQSMNDKIQLVETYVWASVVLIVTVILAGIVMAMLYSVNRRSQSCEYRDSHRDSRNVGTRGGYAMAFAYSCRSSSLTLYKVS